MSDEPTGGIVPDGKLVMLGRGDENEVFIPIEALAWVEDVPPPDHDVPGIMRVEPFSFTLDFHPYPDRYTCKKAVAKFRAGRGLTSKDNRRMLSVRWVVTDIQPAWKGMADAIR